MGQIKSPGIGAFYAAVKFRCHPLGKYDFKLGRADIGPLGELLDRSYQRELYVSPIHFQVTFVICHVLFRDLFEGRKIVHFYLLGTSRSDGVTFMKLGIFVIN